MDQLNKKQRIKSMQIPSSANSAATRPIRDPQSKNNNRRTEQITSLHRQFQDLKRKIKDVQSKNEKILSDIHKKYDKYDFKKKGPQTSQIIIDTSPVIHFQDFQKGPSQYSAEHVSKQSDSDQEYRGGRHLPKRSGSKKGLHQVFTQSAQYHKRQSAPYDERIETGINKSGSQHQRPYTFTNTAQFNTQQNQNPPMSPYISQMQMPFHHFQPQYYSPPPNMHLSMSHAQSSYEGQQNYNHNATNNVIKLEQNLKQQFQKIKFLEEQFLKLQKKYNFLSSRVEDVIENSMETFMEEVARKKLNQIERAVKKCQIKLKRFHNELREKVEDDRSKRNIVINRQKRHSRNKSPKIPTQMVSSSQNKSIKRPTLPYQIGGQHSLNNKSRTSQSGKSAKQFQAIAGKYIEIIKVKNDEIEKAQKRAKQKEKQVTILQSKHILLEKRLNQLQTGSSAQQSRIYSSQSDVKEKEQSKIIKQLELIIQKKDSLILEKDNALEKSFKKKGQYQTKIKKLEKQLKRNQIEFSHQGTQELEIKLRKMEDEIKQKQCLYSDLKDKVNILESQKVEKQCEAYSMSNKIKKFENLFNIKQEKIKQLEKIIQQSNRQNIEDLLQVSMVMDKNEEIAALTDDNEKKEDEINNLKEKLFSLTIHKQASENKSKQLENRNNYLKKQCDSLTIQNDSIKINMRALQFEKYNKTDPRIPFGSAIDEIDSKSEQFYQQKQQLRQDLEQQRKKYEESQKQLKVLKHQSLETNTKIIKLTSELTYVKELLGERQIKCEKYRMDSEQGRAIIQELQNKIHSLQGELETQKKINQQKIRQLEIHMLEFEQEVRAKQQPQQMLGELRNSRHFSEQSFVNYRQNFTTLTTQNESLAQKLRQVQKVIQIQKQVQNNLAGDYRINVEKIKSQIKEKVHKNEILTAQIQRLKRKNRQLELQGMKSNQDQLLLDNDKNQKIMDLEEELNDARDINEKLTAMQQELFKQISEKQEEKNEVLRILTKRNLRIQELEDIIELKDMNFSSHISSSAHRSKVKDSMRSQSSLRYSMLSNNLNNTVNKDRTVQFELSQGESFIQHNQSLISNVSEMFEQQEFPYERMHLKRVQQRRLFEKTASYIKSLKNAINQKNKRIKILEKKVESLRNSELVRKDIYEVKQSGDISDNDSFCDYYSLQMDRAGTIKTKYKQLEHETRLVIQQNNLLNNQIESLQQQIMKAEEQQNSLVKIKDLYKDQIKKLIKKNEEQAKVFQEQMRKERLKVEQSQSVENWQALKQLFLKIMAVVTSIEVEGSKSKKKEEKKKELQSYIQVYCNISGFDTETRSKLTADIKK